MTEINLSPERILLECESLYDASEPGLYGFMIQVLDDENTVFTIAQGNTIRKSDCDRRLEKIGRILKQGKRIYLGGFGELKNLESKAGPTFFLESVHSMVTEDLLALK